MEKLENVKLEMRRLKIQILGLTQLRWKDKGDFTSEDVRVIYCGGLTREKGIALLLDRQAAHCGVRVETISDRWLMVKLKGEPVDIMAVVVYMPATYHPDEDIDEMYGNIESAMNLENGDDYLVLLGDWNSVVEEGKEDLYLGTSVWVQEIREPGEMLTDFCKRKQLIIANTVFFDIISEGGTRGNLLETSADHRLIISC